MQIYEFGNPDASMVLIEPIHVPEGMETEAEMIRKLSGMDRNQPFEPDPVGHKCGRCTYAA